MTRASASRPRKNEANPREIEAFGGAVLMIDAKGAVARAAGWERIFPMPPPRSIAPEEVLGDPLLETVAGMVEAVRSGNHPVHRVVGATTGKQRFYSLAAAPCAGGEVEGATLVMAFEITEAFPVGPREGDAIRHLGHDLKSPLTSISGAVEMLQSGRFGSFNGQQEKLLGILGKGIDMMLALIENATAPFRGAQQDAPLGGPRATDAGRR